MILQQIAKEMSQFIFEKTGFHAIVCDENAVIVADSENARVGMTHSTAQRLLSGNQKEAKISAQEAADSDGLIKEGITLVIQDGGEKLGVFGIAGPMQIVDPISRIATSLIMTKIRDEELKESLNNLANHLTDSLNQTSAAVQQMASSSQDLAETSQGVAALAKDAEATVQETAEILGFINRIAGQTKFLGLNASIEAARAGEHGRGFGVVAQEVGKLAEESSRSVSTISNLLSRFQETIQKVSHGIERNNLANQEQAEGAQNIAEMVVKMQTVGEELNELTQRI